MNKDSRITEQLHLSSMINTEDNFICPLRRIAAVDISFEGDTKIIAGIIIYQLDANENLKNIIYSQKIKKCNDLEVYEHGFLAFREYKIYAELLDNIPSQFYPDLVVVDGNGILHIRKCGSATHLGIMKSIPTIGIAKKFYPIDGNTTKSIKELPTIEYGGHHTITGKTDDYEYAYKLRCSEKSKHCIYMSVGHRISLPTAKKYILKWSIYRIPEPIRIVDLWTRGRVTL